MKNICFEGYRQSKRDRMLLSKPKPKQLDPTWYTDNIYSNRSEDLEEDYVPDCLKYGGVYGGNLRKIREQEEYYGDEAVDAMSALGKEQGQKMSGRRGEGEGSAGYNIHRSISCKEFQGPKSQSYCYGMDAFERRAAAPTASILKNRNQVPKSYSFSVASSKTTPFDVMDYKLPPVGKSRRERQEAYRKTMGYYGSNSLDESVLAHAQEPHVCCAREHCTNPKCVLDDIYAASGSSQTSWTGRKSWRRTGSGLYGTGASSGSNRNLHMTPSDWMDEVRDVGYRGMSSAAPMRYSQHLEQPLAPPTATTSVVCCCTAEDYCCHRQQQHHMASARPRSRLRCASSHHPAAEEEEHLHCRTSYDTELENFIRDERERLMLQDKFLDEDERYLTASSRPRTKYYRRPTRSRSLLEVQPPNRYDEDSCSDSTEMDLEDFNIDLEKYWEELEKPPSPIDLDMQRRNMHSNLKVKNVNVGCYNNGQPIDMHEREQERMFIKKTLLEGMPSPPQFGARQVGVGASAAPPPNPQEYHFFEHAGSPIHRAYNYNKVYPTADALPSYQYNNFYPEHSVQTQQPSAGAHHTSAGGHSALSLINNIFSIYKPNKYSPHNCQMNVETKPEPCKKMNVPSTRRPLGAPHSEYMHSMKRPLIVSNEQPHFKIIPEKTGLKISPLYSYDDYGVDKQPQARLKLTSTARPLMLPH